MKWRKSWCLPGCLEMGLRILKALRDDICGNNGPGSALPEDRWIDHGTKPRRGRVYRRASRILPTGGPQVSGIASSPPAQSHPGASWFLPFWLGSFSELCFFPPTVFAWGISLSWILSRDFPAAFAGETCPGSQDSVLCFPWRTAWKIVILTNRMLESFYLHMALFD